METKRERFVRIAETRTNKILTMVRLLGNCSNTVSYEYSCEDVKKIFDVLEKELRNTKNKFWRMGECETKFSLK
jgi:hypothetical protein